MLTIATLLWDPKGQEKDFSRIYDETWVDKLYRSFFRNLSRSFEFVLYTDRPRSLQCPARQVVIPNLGAGGYADCIRPYEMNVPMILCGLDTIVVGPIDHIAEYVENGGQYALPRDPYRPHIACNGVALVPAGMDTIAKTHTGQNDMEHCRSFPHVFIDDLFPGQVKSYKGYVKRKGWRGVNIVYFHGLEKPHELQAQEPVIRRHWE